jgi:hypothetical protein
VIGPRASQGFTVDEGKKRHSLELGTSDDGGLAISLLGNNPDQDGRAQDRIDLMTRELATAHDQKGATLLGWSSRLSCGVEFSGHPKRIVDCLVEVGAP